VSVPDLELALVTATAAAAAAAHSVCSRHRATGEDRLRRRLPEPNSVVTLVTGARVGYVSKRASVICCNDRTTAHIPRWLKVGGVAVQHAGHARLSSLRRLAVYTSGFL
jgi:hypothetical protein